MEAKDQINILFVSATIPYPTIDGGRIRVLNLVSRLCRIHEVTFLTFIASSADEQGAAYLREMGMEVVGIRRPEQKSGSRALNAFAALVGLLKSSIQRKPLTVAKYYSVEMVEALERLLRSRRFHIVHFEMLHTGQFLSDLRAERAIRMAEEPELTKVVFEAPRYWDNFSLNFLALGPNPHHPFRRESTLLS